MSCVRSVKYKFTDVDQLVSKSGRVADLVPSTLAAGKSGKCSYLSNEPILPSWLTCNIKITSYTTLQSQISIANGSYQPKTRPDRTGALYMTQSSS